MAIQSRTTDHESRVTLPKAFANSVVIVEEISETEIRIRKVKAIPEDDLRLCEESSTPLSDRDRDVFLSMLDDPPPPNEALRRAAVRYKQRHGPQVD
jgi:hypothetical protein